MAGKLSERDLVFADEYMVDLDAKNAALRAGYKLETAKKASEWIRADNPTKPRLKEEIEKRLAERARRTGITADRIMNEAAKIAFANIDDIIDLKTGEIRENVQRDDMAAIARVRIKKTSHCTEVDIYLENRIHALELIGKGEGVFEKRSESDSKNEISKLDKILENITHAAQS